MENFVTAVGLGGALVSYARDVGVSNMTIGQRAPLARLTTIPDVACLIGITTRELETGLIRTGAVPCGGLERWVTPGELMPVFTVQQMFDALSYLRDLWPIESGERSIYADFIMTYTRLLAPRSA